MMRVHHLLLARPMRLAKVGRVTFSNQARVISYAGSSGDGSQKVGNAATFLIAAVALAYANFESEIVTYNHCQVPCGIFDDPAVVGELRQACTTIRKAMRSSRVLHQTMGADLLSLNQIVRWIDTKEEHCDKIISLISNYCLCQRVKPTEFKSESDYLQVLKVHHAAMQAAMKAKQSMDEQECIALEHAIEDLAKIYSR